MYIYNLIYIFYVCKYSIIDIFNACKYNLYFVNGSFIMTQINVIFNIAISSPTCKSLIFYIDIPQILSNLLINQF